VTQAGASDTDLFRYLRNGEAGAVKKALADGVSSNAKDGDGLTALMHAAAFSSPKCVELLVSEGADINAVGPESATALMYALPDTAKARLLIQKGANVNSKLSDGKTVLMFAVRLHGQAELVRLLLTKGADATAKDEDGGTALMYAARAGNVEAMGLLLKKDVDVNAAAGPGFGKFSFGTLVDPARKAAVMEGGFTALIGAAASGDERAVAMLLERGANVNAAVDGGYTPLLMTIMSGCKPQIARMLVDKRAKVNVGDYRGATPLIAVASSDCFNAAESARVLLEAGADLTAKTRSGESALDWALKRGETPLVKLLREAGAVGSSSTPAAAEGRHSSPESLARSIDKSIALLQNSGVQFFRKAACISCHHQSITSMTIAAVRPRAGGIDEKSANQILKANLAVFSPHRLGLLLANSGVPVPEFVSSYAMVSLAAEEYPADSLTDAMVCDLATRQLADGHWRADGERPPIGSSEMESTALTMRSLQLYGPPGRRAEFGARIARARQWLSKAEPINHQGRVFRLLGLGWADADHTIIQKAAKELASTQRSDGGWAGLPHLDSDAYATGLALVALHDGANLPVTDPGYQRGIRYLLRTQLDDGSWHVKSRAHGFQPYFESGYPHDHDQWISNMGAGWATMALSYALKPARRASR
jgi:ankyrin repeat protein